MPQRNSPLDPWGFTKRASQNAIALCPNRRFERRANDCLCALERNRCSQCSALCQVEHDDHEVRAAISRLVLQFGEDDPLDMDHIWEKVMTASASIIFGSAGTGLNAMRLTSPFASLIILATGISRHFSSAEA